MATHRQTMTYNAMSRPETITENNHTIEFSYNGRGERVYSRFYEKDNTNPVLGTVITDLERRYYLGNIYERHINEDGEEKIILYLGGDAYSAPAAFVMDEEYGPHMAYICRDNLGSITHVISDQYTKEYSYDAWGNLRDPDTYELYFPRSTQNSFFLGRGYTGHEHHGYFGLINMNARMYEPILGRFISPDPFVQMPDNSQNFNRYTYCLNNPLRYTDESGEIFWLIPAIGAAIGAYMGGVIANDSYNPTKWDFSSGKTWWNMLAGSAVGGLSAYVGSAIATSGIAAAQTISIAGSSLTNSFGTWLYTGGETDLSISLGAASFNFSTGSFGYLGKKGNSKLENIGYGLGAVANMQDIITGLYSSSITLRTANSSTNSTSKDIIGHSQLEQNGNILIDWGPENVADPFGIYDATNSFERGNLVTDFPDSKFWQPIKINGVNSKVIANYSRFISNYGGKYQMFFNSCVSKASRALNLGGVFNIGVLPGINHPYWLHAQMYLYTKGFRPLTYSHYLQNQ